MSFLGKIRDAFFGLPPLDHSTLEGYTEDHAARRRFERGFLIPSLLGLGLFTAGIIGLTVYQGPVSLLALCGAGFGMLILTVLVMFGSTPRSSETGRPMEKYWNTSKLAEGNEVLYVCRDSRTYFRRTYAKRSRYS